MMGIHNYTSQSTRKMSVNSSEANNYLRGPEFIIREMKRVEMQNLKQKACMNYQKWK